MQEFLIVINDHIDQDIINTYLENANRHFHKFDLTFTSKMYFRNNFALIWFGTDDNIQQNILENNITGDLLACIGTWFFREGSNDRHKNLFLLLNKLLRNTAQELQEIEGAYNFILYNANTQVLKLITDRIGLRPIYTRQIGTLELISSNCLLLASLNPFELDTVGLKEFLLANKLFGSTTLFKTVKKLDPGSILEYKETGKHIVSYWSIPWRQRKMTLSTPEKVEMLTTELQKVMRSIAELFKSPFVDLTGGWDSRTAIITMPGSVPQFITVTSGQIEDEDVIIAKQIAQKLGVPHYCNTPFITSELFSLEKYAEYLKKSLFLTDGAMSSPLYVSTLANQLSNLTHGADITLNGSGGELYRSYWWDPARFYNSELKQFKISIPGITTYYNKRELVRRAIHQNSDLSIFTHDFDTDIYGHLIDIFDKTNKPHMPLSNIEQIANIYIVHRMGNWLAGYSKATSRFLNCFSPLLMSKPLEIALQLSLKEKAYGSFLRRFHSSVHPEIAKITTCYGYPTEPLSFGNWVQFLPAAKEEFQYISAKIASKAGVKTKNTGNPLYKRNLKNIREFLILQPEKMKLIDIFKKQQLSDFLKKSKDVNFLYTDFYNNIYTVEAILNILL